MTAFRNVDSPEFKDALDRHITGNYGADQERRMLPGVEDVLGRKVVVGTNDWGLGRWGEVVDFTEWTDEDEDGRYGGVSLEVEFSDGGYPTWDSISLEEAQRQFAKPTARRANG